MPPATPRRLPWMVGWTWATRRGSLPPAPRFSSRDTRYSVAARPSVRPASFGRRRSKVRPVERLDAWDRRARTRDVWFSLTAGDHADPRPLYSDAWPAGDIYEHDSGPLRGNGQDGGGL